MYRSSAWPSGRPPSSAEPITLKLAFSTSDQSAAYKSAAEPFVNAVNAEGQGLIRIEPYFSGALGKEMSQQAQLVRDGVADIAYIIPSYTRDRFPDNAIVEMPGLYRDMREGTLVYRA